MNRRGFIGRFLAAMTAPIAVKAVASLPEIAPAAVAPVVAEAAPIVSGNVVDGYNSFTMCSYATACTIGLDPHSSHDANALARWYKYQHNK